MSSIQSNSRSCLLVVERLLWECLSRNDVKMLDICTPSSLHHRITIRRATIIGMRTLRNYVHKPSCCELFWETSMPISSWFVPHITSRDFLCILMVIFYFRVLLYVQKSFFSSVSQLLVQFIPFKAFPIVVLGLKSFLWWFFISSQWLWSLVCQVMIDTHLWKYFVMWYTCIFWSFQFIIDFIQFLRIQFIMSRG